MFERFTERARQVVVKAQEEARELGHDHVGSEHLLLGLVRDEECVGARALMSLGITLERTREEVLRHVARGQGPPSSGQIPFTPLAKQVLERALEEAIQLGHNYLGTEHLLIALASVDEGVAATVLRDLGAGANEIRNAVVTRVSGGGGEQMPTQPRWRGHGRRAARVSVGAVPALVGGFQVVPDDEVVRLLMAAAALALEDGRTEMSAADLVIALSRAERVGALLAELGAGEAAIRAALERRGAPGEPPEAAAGG